ncbi:lariat debranching enzyme B-like [Rhopilema esculentum]|uniref:lariat debranching enzyme B-like n=1 Tax=Rhopilema esculentum TaxID=499914 RepID=UPI0031D982CB
MSGGRPILCYHNEGSCTFGSNSKFLKRYLPTVPKIMSDEKASQFGEATPDAGCLLTEAEEDACGENVCIAVQGCCHGELEKIYETVQYIQTAKNKKIDLLICCGDFQAVRDHEDLLSMAVPPKYRQMGVFKDYYSGVKTAPVLTLFIGGNHEASKHLWELPFGGWVAPNIYYLGYAGVVNYGGFKIGGISGIYKDHDFYKGHFEMPPFNDSTMRSIYHTRSYEVFKLKVLKEHLDIFISHDWPKNVYNYGDVEDLLRKKRFFREEVESKRLGSPACLELLKALKPSFWFAAHLHVKFAALVEHKENGDGEKTFTKFLALDKCLPNRNFLQVIDMGPSTGKKELQYDEEWLAVTKSTYTLYNATSRATWVPRNDEELEKYRITDKQINEIRETFKDLSIPQNFERTNSSNSKSGNSNNQTMELCEKLDIKNPCNISIIRKTENYGHSNKVGSRDTSSDLDSSSSDDFNEIPNFAGDPSEISLDDDSSDDGDESALSSTSFSKSSEVDSQAESKEMKRKHSSDEFSDEPSQKPTFLVRRNKALYASLDDDNSGSSSSDCL